MQILKYKLKNNTNYAIITEFIYTRATDEGEYKTEFRSLASQTILNNINDVHWERRIQSYFDKISLLMLTHEEQYKYDLGNATAVRIKCWEIKPPKNYRTITPPKHKLAQESTYLEKSRIQELNKHLP